MLLYVYRQHSNFLLCSLLGSCVEGMSPIQCFGSGAIHGIYAQFLAQAAIHNKGKKIGLLGGLEHDLPLGSMQ